MTSPDTEALVKALEDWHRDPMWADHVEMPKAFLRRTITAIQSLTATIAEQAKEIERLKDENHNLGNEISALEEEGCAADDTIRAAESRVSALSAEVERLRAVLEDIANSDDVDNALDPARNKRVARASLNGGSDHD